MNPNLDYKSIQGEFFVFDCFQVLFQFKLRLANMVWQCSKQLTSTNVFSERRLGINRSHTQWTKDLSLFFFWLFTNFCPCQVWYEGLWCWDWSWSYELSEFKLIQDVLERVYSMNNKIKRIKRKLTKRNKTWESWWIMGTKFRIILNCEYSLQS